MATRRTNPPNVSAGRGRPATTPEARENQLITAAVDLAEKQIKEGTASAQVITHYLKLGSSRERLEQEKVGLENELLIAKREAMASAQRVEAMYAEALNAMRSYAGQQPLEMLDDDDDY
jgi:hypothetical protein